MIRTSEQRSGCGTISDQYAHVGQEGHQSRKTKTVSRDGIAQNHGPLFRFGLTLLLDRVAHLGVFEPDQLVVNITVAMKLGEELEGKVVSVLANVESRSFGHELGANQYSEGQRDLNDIWSALIVIRTESVAFVTRAYPLPGTRHIRATKINPRDHHSAKNVEGVLSLSVRVQARAVYIESELARLTHAWAARARDLGWATSWIMTWEVIKYAASPKPRIIRPTM